MDWESEVEAAARAAADGPDFADDRGGPDAPEDALVVKLRKAGEFPLNDYGNGQRLRLYHGDDLRFVPRVAWFVWDGRRWRQDDNGLSVRQRAHEVQALIKREAFELRPDEADREMLATADECRPRIAALKARKALSDDEAAELERMKAIVQAAGEAQKRLGDRRGKHLRHAKSAGNSGPVSNMQVEAQPYCETPLAALNADPMAINVENATLELVEMNPEDDLPSREFGVVEHRHRREHLISKLMPVEYDPDAVCPTFDAFLADIQPDEEMRAFLQRWFGYSLTGLTSEQKLVFLHGTGRNGKSTLVDLIAKILGEYATSVPIETLTGSEQRKGSDATPDLVRLPGARMVRASEPEEGVRFREALVKLLTGGEPIMIRRMREEFVEIAPVFKLTISGNHKPNVRGTDDGIWRRILLVPFDEQIPIERVDPLLPQKLWAERSGILNWLIRGALHFLNGGLQEPAAVLEATEEFREDSDPVRVFLSEACEITGEPDDFLHSRDLIEAFEAWQREAGQQPWGKRTVSLRFAEKAEVFRAVPGGPTFMPTRTAAQKGYAGVRLTPDGDRMLQDMRRAQGRFRGDE